MSGRYVPAPPPRGLDPTVAQYLQQELQRIAERLDLILDLDVLDATPAKPREGMVRYFSVTAGLSGGPGIYVYTSGTWASLH